MYWRIFLQNHASYLMSLGALWHFTQIPINVSVHRSVSLSTFSDGDIVKCHTSQHKQRKADELNLMKQRCPLKRILAFILVVFGRRCDSSFTVHWECQVYQRLLMGALDQQSQGLKLEFKSGILHFLLQHWLHTYLHSAKEVMSHSQQTDWHYRFCKYFLGGFIFYVKVQ